MAESPTFEKFRSLLHLARNIQSQYNGREHEMPAETIQQVKSLTSEAMRLKAVCEQEEAISSLSAWESEPGEMPPDVAAKAMADAAAGPRDAGMDTKAAMDSGLELKRFAKMVRNGVGSLTFEEKAALVEDATGEALVPEAVAGPIYKTLPALAVVRRIATIVPVSSNRLNVRSLTSGSVGWNKLETGTGTLSDAQGATPAAGQDPEIVVHNLMAKATLGEDEAADSDANLVSLIQSRTAELFAEAEDIAFAAGNGTSEPQGVVLGVTNTLASGTSDALQASSLKSLAYKVSARFRRGGVYTVSNDAEEAIALLTDGDGRFLLQPAANQGEPSTLFGYPIHTLEGLPALDATAGGADKSVIFGNWRQGYAIADRQRISVRRLDDSVYAEAGKFALLFKLRVGGGVIRPAAFAALTA